MRCFRIRLVSIFIALFVALSLPAFADYPDKPIRLRTRNCADYVTGIGYASDCPTLVRAIRPQGFLHKDGFIAVTELIAFVATGQLKRYSYEIFSHIISDARIAGIRRMHRTHGTTRQHW